MRSRLTILFILLSLGCFAQPETLSKYYRFIHSAELAIVYGKPDSSAFYYTEAFRNRPLPFARDLRNASIVNTRLNKFDIVYAQLEKLVRLGLSVDQLKTDTVYSRFFRSAYGRNFLKHCSQWKPIYQKAYRNKIRELIALDQSLRRKANAYTHHMDSIRAIDKRNILSFVQMIRERGFPTESAVGIEATNVINPLYFAVIAHQSSGYTQYDSLYALIRHHILEGNIENKMGAYMLERINGGSVLNVIKLQYVTVRDSTRSAANPHNVVVKESSDWGIFPLTGELVAKEDLKRQELMLDNYKENLLKALFNLSNREYALAGSGEGAYINYTSLEGYKKESEKLLTGSRIIEGR
ncbi:MAG TPA: hypothetical protein VFR58_06870 [Flavisolibacter sp.]|nr:hypothetical protein [Flavisolibacter sp.]